MKNIEQLANELNKISLNHPDLLGIVLDYIPIFLKYRKQDTLHMDDLLNNIQVTNLSCFIVKQSIVISIQMITLNKDIDFKLLTSLFFEDNFNFSFINLSIQQNILLKEFLISISKEVVGRVYVQNKESISITQLTSQVLEQRFNIILEYLNEI